MGFTQKLFLTLACVASAFAIFWLGVLTLVTIDINKIVNPVEVEEWAGGNTTRNRSYWRVLDNNLVPRSDAWELGIVSTTPFAQLGIGVGGDTTSTISTGKFCLYAGDEAGVPFYIYISSDGAGGNVFATTTVSCF